LTVLSPLGIVGALMPRRLVVCCDGTWNLPDEVRDGVAAPTNVAKVALGLATGGDSGQELFYEPGVGTTPDERILGGAFGYGLSRNVRSCYRFLAQKYEPGDELFLFGFSRGAYTARSLAGLIRNCGILQQAHVDQVDEAFAFYRDRTSQTHPSALASQIFRKMYSHEQDDIHFIGVWDTVGALGIPAKLPGWEWLSEHLHGWEQQWGFHDTRLSSHVKFAYQALAIDEEREPFQPTLWDEDDTAHGQTLEQVWFAGVHTEVGGGSKDPSLSDIALLWMVEKAKACGLVFEPGQLEPGGRSGAGEVVAPNYAAPIVDSRKGVYAALHPYHRLTHADVAAAPGQSIASSADRRFTEKVDNYSPRGFAEYLAVKPVVPVEEGHA
jgi:uncharacterized protein (DUF2235 family)